MSKFAGTMFERRNWKRVYQVAGLMREKISNCESKLILVALTVAGCLMTAGVVLALGRLMSDDDGVAIGMPGSGGQPASSAKHRR
jgi:glucose-6-phosphate dehydrogenase assembly protein OpcA